MVGCGKGSFLATKTLQSNKLNVLQRASFLKELWLTENQSIILRLSRVTLQKMRNICFFWKAILITVSYCRKNSSWSFRISYLSITIKIYPLKISPTSFRLYNQAMRNPLSIPKLLVVNFDLAQKSTGLYRIWSVLFGKKVRVSKE